MGGGGGGGGSGGNGGAEIIIKKRVWKLDDGGCRCRGVCVFSKGRWETVSKMYWMGVNEWYVTCSFCRSRVISRSLSCKEGTWVRERR